MMKGGVNQGVGLWTRKVTRWLRRITAPVALSLILLGFKQEPPSASSSEDDVLQAVLKFVSQSTPAQIAAGVVFGLWAIGRMQNWYENKRGKEDKPPQPSSASSNKLIDGMEEDERYKFYERMLQQQTRHIEDMRELTRILIEHYADGDD